MGAISVRVSNARQFGRLAERIRRATAGDGIGGEIRKEWTRTAPRVVRKVQAQARSASFPAVEPSRRRQRGSSQELRARLADSVESTQLERPAGVRFRVDGSRVDPADPRAGHRLAMYSDGRARKKWRSPTFGRTANPQDWKNQRPDPWFDAPIEAARPQFEAGAERGIERVARRIEGRTG